MTLLTVARIILGSKIRFFIGGIVILELLSYTKVH